MSISPPKHGFCFHFSKLPVTNCTYFVESEQLFLCYSISKHGLVCRSVQKVMQLTFWEVMGANRPSSPPTHSQTLYKICCFLNYSYTVNLNHLNCICHCISLMKSTVAVPRKHKALEKRFLKVNGLKGLEIAHFGCQSESSSSSENTNVLKVFHQIRCQL